MVICTRGFRSEFLNNALSTGHSCVQWPTACARHRHRSARASMKTQTVGISSKRRQATLGDEPFGRQPHGAPQARTSDRRGPWWHQTRRLCWEEQWRASYQTLTPRLAVAQKRTLSPYCIEGAFQRTGADLACVTCIGLLGKHSGRQRFRLVFLVTGGAEHHSHGKVSTAYAQA